MSYVEVTGYGYSRKLCKDVTNWFLSSFLPRHKLYIEIWHHGLKREGVWGYCDVIGSTYKPREFLIEIQSGLDKKDYIKTILHEFVHLEDFCRDRLKIKSSKRYYNGIDVEELNYDEQPHEIKAYQMEEILYHQYINQK
jgi:hypothetical protein